MKKLLVPLLLLIISLLNTGCSKDEDQPTPTPVAGFNYDGAGEYAPCTVLFTNTSTNSSSFSWDFGDNGTSTEKNPSHTFQQGGTYTVTLKALGTGGENSTSKTINILYAPTEARIKKLTIIDIPFIDPSTSSGWDPNSGPDLFFTVLGPNPNNEMLVNGDNSIYDDLETTELPIFWNFSAPDYFQVPTLDETYFIYIWDNDTGLYYPDDEIGYVSFNMSNYMSGLNPYPIEIEITQNNITLKIEIAWQ